MSESCPEVSRFCPKSYVKVAADSIGELRRCDVYRLLSGLDEDKRSLMAAWIIDGRPDLKAEVAACLHDIASDEAA